MVATTTAIHRETGTNNMMTCFAPYKRVSSSSSSSDRADPLWAGALLFLSGRVLTSLSWCSSACKLPTYYYISAWQRTVAVNVWNENLKAWLCLSCDTFELGYKFNNFWTKQCMATCQTLHFYPVNVACNQCNRKGRPLYLKTHTLILISQVLYDLNSVWSYFWDKSIVFLVSHLCGVSRNEKTS